MKLEILVVLSIFFTAFASAATTLCELPTDFGLSSCLQVLIMGGKCAAQQSTQGKPTYEKWCNRVNKTCRATARRKDNAAQAKMQQANADCPDQGDADCARANKAVYLATLKQLEAAWCSCIKVGC